MPENTLLVDGQDLRLVDGLLIDGDMALRAPRTRRGDDETIPRRQGVVAVAGLPVDAYTFEVPVIVLGGSRGEREDIIDALDVLLAGTGGDGLVALERRLDDGAGGYVAATAQGRFLQGMAVQLLNDRTGSTALLFKNLDGLWTPDGGTTWLA